MLAIDYIGSTAAGRIVTRIEQDESNIYCYDHNELLQIVQHLDSNMPERTPDVTD